MDYFFLKVVSSETVSFFLPFFLRAEMTLRPLAEAILSRNPCLFFLFLFEGWNVRFMFYQFILKGVQKWSGFLGFTRSRQLIFRDFAELRSN
jgi:hypothetical protein